MVEVKPLLKEMIAFYYKNKHKINFRFVILQSGVKLKEVNCEEFNSF